MFATLPPERDAHGADADVLDSRLAERASLLERELSARRRAGGHGGRGRPIAKEAGRRRRGAPRRRSRGREDTERAFLALCIASPEEGARALGELEVDEHFSSELLRRAAGTCARATCASRWPSAPGERGLDDDPELKGLLAELIVQAGARRRDPGDARGAAPAARDGAHGPRDPPGARAARTPT